MDGRTMHWVLLAYVTFTLFCFKTSRLISLLVYSTRSWLCLRILFFVYQQKLQARNWKRCKNPPLYVRIYRNSRVSWWIFLQLLSLLSTQLWRHQPI